MIIIFGIDKTDFDQPGEFVKEARKHRKIPKSAPKGNFRKIKILKSMPKIKTTIFFLKKTIFEARQ